MSVFDQVKELAYLKKDNFALFFPAIKPASFNQNIKNWLKSGKLIKLKRGFYVPEEYWRNCANKEDFLCYLSSLLHSPSYISKETVLVKYGILSESVYGVAAIADSATKNYRSNIANFSYSKIKKALFTGFSTKQFEKNSFNIATKSKALFDYLYFIKRTMQSVNEKTVAELRLNLEAFSLQDWQEFEKYLQLAKSKKMERIYKLLRRKNAV